MVFLQLKSIQLGRFAICPLIQYRGYVYCSAGGRISQALPRIPVHTHAGLFMRPTLPYVHSAAPLSHHQTVAHSVDLSSRKYTLIYTFPTIGVLRALSKFKVIQTGITAVVLPPLYYLFLQGDVSLSLVSNSTAIAVLVAFMLYSISHFAKRVVGRMYLDSSGATLKVSHLTFWGRRNELYMPVNDVMTISDVSNPNETIFYLKRYSTTDKMYFSTRIGHVVDKSGFEKVFGTLS